ncbi:MAG: SMC-Scp complex subunit ScpB [Erysipelothrix sp.]|nr:SMC-Scp complex subunit ScpB [Erysipelothrix sp.]
MNYKSSLEALLFAFGDDGVSKKDIQEKFEMNKESFEAFLEEFKAFYKEGDSALECVEYGKNLKFITKKEHHALITELLEVNTSRNFSQAALETLAIIAYKQPITRLEIEEIRGVNSDMMCRRLEALELIREAGRSDSVGRPILYEVTDGFMDVFKLTSLKELPEIKLEDLVEENGLFKTD